MGTGGQGWNPGYQLGGYVRSEGEGHSDRGNSGGVE